MKACNIFSISGMGFLYSRIVYFYLLLSEDKKICKYVSRPYTGIESPFTLHTIVVIVVARDMYKCSRPRVRKRKSHGRRDRRRHVLFPRIRCRDRAQRQIVSTRICILKRVAIETNVL